MKKIFIFLCAVTLCVSVLCSCGELEGISEVVGTYDAVGEEGDENFVNKYEGTTLNVFNWALYISDGSEGSLDVNEAFEALTGIHVNYVTYESNEALYAKMKSGAVSYDIIIPSDYMIERMKNEGMLQKLDFSKIDNYHYIDERYKNLYFDENNEYSVPYNCGLVGLIYNTALVDEAPTSWMALWDEKYSGDLITFNNPRDCFAIAQFALGLSLNTTDTSEWDSAAELLKKQNPVLQGRYMDEVFGKMESGNAVMAPYYVGDFVTMQESNPDLELVFPVEGTNIFVDSICIPANAEHYEAALMYINFLLEPEVALANAENIRYTSPHTDVVNNDDYSLKGNKYVYPSDEILENTEYFHDLDPEIRSYYEKLWEEVLLAGK